MPFPDPEGVVAPAAFPLTAWAPRHGATAVLDATGRLVLGDTPGLDWQLLRIAHPAFAGAQVTLHLVLAPAPDCDTEFYVNHWGGIDICRIAASGKVLAQREDCRLRSIRRPDGTLALEIGFINRHETVSIGTAQGPGGRYAGSGRPQYLISSIEVATAPLPWARPRSEAERIVFVDVGAMGGLQPAWAMLGDAIRPVLFEPNPATASQLRPMLAAFPGGQVMQAALFNQAGRRPLYVTRHPGCSSLLKPDRAVLDRYRLARIFDVIEEVEVDCTRYDTLHAAGLVPRPDVLKVDVQGAEYEVLEGFGALLDTCLGIELETHTYPIYQHQRLMHEVIALLDRHGLSLRKLEEQRNFDGDAVEFDAFFTRRAAAMPQAEALAAAKLATIEQVWQLDVSGGGAWIAASVA